jgi:hypothetical protein
MRTILVHLNFQIPEAADALDAEKVAELVRGALEVGLGGSPVLDEMGVDLSFEVALAEEV